MQPLLNRSRSLLGRMLQRTFPDDGHTPATISEHHSMPSIAIDIALEFLSPERLVSSGSGGIATACVSVPEAAMDEHHCPVLGEYEVRGAGQLSDMKSISESFGEKKGTKSPFRPSIFSANPRHHVTALRSGRDAHGLEGISPECLQKLSLRISANRQSTRTDDARNYVEKLSTQLIREKSRGAH